MKRSLLKATTAWVMAAAILNPLAIAGAAPVSEPTLTLAGAAGTVGAGQAANLSSQSGLSLQQKIALLRTKVKYVFVLFQENRSLDHYFGTYPGTNGLYSTYPGANPNDIYAQPATSFSSFKSVIRNTDGTYSTVSPFLIPRTIQNQAGQTTQLWPEDTYSVDHAHSGFTNDFHFADANKTTPQNDGYPLDQQGLHYATTASGTTASIFNSSNVAPTSNPTLQTKQKGEVVISHVDCDTVPFLWQLADRFTLFDNFHQTMTGPSTPNAIAMIAAQTGDTQWAKHPGEGDPTGLSLPNLTDSAPFAGSTSDTAAIQPPYGPDESTNGTSTAPNTVYTSFPAQQNLTFATLPLSFAGTSISSVIASDQNASADLDDVSDDIVSIKLKHSPVDWGWYQQGYGPEPFDGAVTKIDALNYSQGAPQHASYIVHHNGPQYFGYIGDNPQMTAHMHGLQQFYTDVTNQALPAGGGVFYVRGGYYNNDGMQPADPNTTVQAATPGNDDHPNYSDAGISESLIAESVNAIAKSPYWSQSAIIITYDETDGLYDHQPEQFRTYGPDHNPETGGPRIPAIVISPFSAAHTISHVYSEHSSVVQLIDLLFNLTPLADLPNEAGARTAGAANSALNAPDGSSQKNLGPADDPSVLSYAAGMGNMLEAFDNDRLMGKKPLLPASYAMITAAPPSGITLKASASAVVTSLPHFAGTNAQGTPTYGCQYLGITPTDYPGGYALGGESDPPPQDFNPRPTESPGMPFLNINNNTAVDPTTASTGPWDPAPAATP